MAVRYARRPRTAGVATVPLESTDQENVFAWARLTVIGGLGLLSQFMFAIPNGQMLAGNTGQRARYMRALIKRGLRPGASDIMLALPRGPWPGAFIEMKRKGATPSSVSTAQISFQQDMGAAGYFCVTARGLDEAIKYITEYLSYGPPSSNHS